MDGVQRRELHALMVRLADGDRSALDPVYALLTPILVRFCRKMLGDVTAGDDAAQQALLAIFLRVSELDPERDGLSWAFGLAAWECRTIRRRGQRRGEIPLAAAEDVPDTASSAVTALAEKQALEALEACVGSLAPADVAVVAAALRGEREVGATFRKRLERALGRLRALWRSRHGT
jgi:RNA polymerase sigma-70 factor (ECF subfamily)